VRHTTRAGPDDATVGWVEPDAAHGERREKMTGNRGGTMKTVDVRFDEETLARIDAITRARSRREKRKVTRSEVLRGVVGAGLPLKEEQLSKRHADADVPEQAQATHDGERGRPSPPQRAMLPSRRARPRRRVKGEPS
jgi:hypothetical protein